MPAISHPDLLVGTSTGDDAAVWRVCDDRALIATVDFFAPLVDDARTWGAIAAANSASDVYAMGGRPLFALNVAAWPRDVLDLDLLGDVLEGASSIADRGGWLIVGGHTIDGPEPMFGQTVIGEADPSKIMTNDAARAGDAIVLTKPIGTGIVATALKRLDSTATEGGGVLARAYSAAVASMTTLNDAASRVALRHGISAATDITGFGLLGHLHKLAVASGVAINLCVNDIPLLPDVVPLAADGFVPGGTDRNIEFVRAHVVANEAAPGWWPELLGDPQTSGGLALCVPQARVTALCDELRHEGCLAAVIGEVSDAMAGAAGSIRLT